MRVRDATEADVEAIATLIGTSRDATRGMLRDRTVRVGVAEDAIEAVVCFDATESAVHITRLEGDPACFDSLLESTLRFAQGIDRPVETVVPRSATALREALAAKGFEPAGAGPRFDGELTDWYRRPDDADG